MLSRFDLLLDLLHTSPEGALATHSLALPGFPYASTLPFVPDAQHSPVFLVSRLAEHTQNLLQDARASLLIRKPGAGAEVARATLVGPVQEIDAEPLLVARYLRYQPEAERFLQLGDFRFFRQQPQRARLIGGFAQATWIEGTRLADAPSLAAAVEAEWIDAIAGNVPAPVTLLGIDCFGIDIAVADGEAAYRTRVLFKPGPVLGEAIGPALKRALAQLA